jgi:acetoin utilization protein AcuB
MFVRDWMSTPALSVPADTPAEMALGFMESRGLHRVPVVERGALVGMATKDDLVRVVGLSDRGHRPKNPIIGDIMTKRPPAITPGATLEEAARKMLHYNLDGLPVAQEGRLLGILTKSDFFRVFLGTRGLGEIPNDSPFELQPKVEPNEWEMQSAGG